MHGDRMSGDVAGGDMTTDKLTSLHITIPDLRGMLPGVETAVSTAFWVPLAEFVLRRSGTFEVVCQREDTDAIKLLMPVAETIERQARRRSTDVLGHSHARSHQGRLPGGTVPVTSLSGGGRLP